MVVRDRAQEDEIFVAQYCPPEAWTSNGSNDLMFASVNGKDSVAPHFGRAPRSIRALDMVWAEDDFVKLKRGLGWDRSCGLFDAAEENG